MNWQVPYSMTMNRQIVLFVGILYYNTELTNGIIIYKTVGYGYSSEFYSVVHSVCFGLHISNYVHEVSLS